ncbi:amidase domain-containing protein [Paenibacillus assamensis]|uniref:amidase domain-containing protein n=1 Tax=Paenibacillus assamensis TaxID=311244 RepID=UPI000425A78B|nr:amidase domain-containing protein [Paenibacillus assamensis]
MIKLKKLITGFSCLVFLISAVPVSASPSEIINNSNKYVEQYFKEKTEKSLIETNSEKVYLVDPVIEEKNMIEALNYYYEEDTKVANVISQAYKDPELLVKATSLKKEDRIEVVEKIVSVFKSVEDRAHQQLLEEYLGRYSYNLGNQLSIDFLDSLNQVTKQESVIDINQEKSKNNLLITTDLAETLSTYNGTAAGDWAYNNYNKYSTNFPAFTAWGSDCTNFVSQAMHVGGGKQMAGDWYVTKKNSTYLVPKSAAELNHSWTLSDPSPWISVVQFTKYWGPKSVDHSMSKIHYRDNHTSVYGRTIYKGDVVVLSKGIAGFITTPTHLMIISGYDTNTKDFLLAGHSNERQAHPLLTAMSDYVHINFYEIP